MANSITITVWEALVSLKNSEMPLELELAIATFEQTLKGYPNKGKLLNHEFDIKYDKITGSAGGGTAVDPKDPMEKLARALSNAESVLNTQNLVITNALVEMNLNIDAGSGAGADTTVKFGIEPQSSH